MKFEAFPESYLGRAKSNRTGQSVSQPGGLGGLQSVSQSGGLGGLQIQHLIGQYLLSDSLCGLVVNVVNCGLTGHRSNLPRARAL